MVGKIFVESKCRDKAIKTRNSYPQGETMEYGRKSQGDGENNVKIGKWTQAGVAERAQHIHYQDQKMLMAKVNRLQKKV